MRKPTCRTFMRLGQILAVLLPGWPLATLPASSPADSLTLEQAMTLAVNEQPLMAAEAARSRALRQEAVAEGEFPDPRLIAGVMQMPITGNDAYSLRDDDFTALSVGLAQELPRAAKRKLRSTRLEQEAASREAAYLGVERQIRREAGWAYLEAFRADAAGRLVDALLQEAGRQGDGSRIGLSVGRETQPGVLAAIVAAEVIRDRRDTYQQQELAARAVLGRWIGPAADRALPDELPDIPDAPRLDVLLAGLQEHPALAERDADASLALTDLKLAAENLRPDWRVEIRYDHRLEFSDLVTLMVGVDLPIFPGQRQDQRTAAALNKLQVSRGERDNALREASAALASAWRNWRTGSDRLQRYDQSLLPAARQRVTAAVAGYASGNEPLSSVLEGRSSLLELELMRLDLQVSVLRERLTLQYFEMAVGQ